MADYDAIAAALAAKQADPWAWRSDMDAPRNSLVQALLKPGPAPTGRDKVFDTAYGYLGGTPDKRRLAETLTSLFDVGTLGMATGAYDGGGRLARTGDPTALALALMPGAKAAQPIETAARTIASGAEKALGKSLPSDILAKNEAGYFPPSKPQRPFEADYARGTPEGGHGDVLQRDIDGRALTARYIAGRRTVGGDDIGLTASEIKKVADYAAAHVASVPRAELPGRAVGTFNPVNQSIRVANDIPPDQQAIALAHETGHAIDSWPHKANTKAHEKAAREVYSDLATGQPQIIPSKRTGPEQHGYRKNEIAPELIAEAIRAYMQDPNYLKSVSPALAKEVRKLNDVKGLRDIIQFNTPLAGLGLGAAALWPGEGDGQ